MKIKNIAATILLASFAMSFSSCSGDENTPIEENVISELKMSVDDVKVVVGNKSEIEISKGNGDYKVFSLNPAIASVKLENGKLVIEGKGNGKTSIVVSDQANLYKKVSVVSLYDKITVSQEVIDVKMPIGNPKLTTIEVLSGNGGYTVTSDNKDIVSTSVNKNIISINALKEGKAVLTIKDALDVVKVITVNIATTDIAYDAKEIEAIKADSELRYVFVQSSMINEQNRWYTFFNKQVDNLNLYGWDYYNYQYLKIYFAGDKSVGVKSDSKLTVEVDSYSFADEPIKFEIIKNDGTKIWAIYSFIKDNRLYFGNFCQNIN